MQKVHNRLPGNMQKVHIDVASTHERPLELRNSTTAPASQSTKILLAFLAVYVVWGSTYLAIRFAVETIPPFLMAGVRFFIAGAVLYAWLRVRGTAAPTVAQWKSMSIVGILLIAGGNGAVSWAEQTVPSGLTALIIALIPLWFVIIEWVKDAHRPSWQVALGLALGFAGMVLLIDPARITGTGEVDLIGAAAVVFGTMAWAAGSMYSRSAQHSPRPLLGTAVQMIAGGAILIVFSTFLGEPFHFNPADVSLRSFASILYLIVFGSWIAFTSYIWLLRASTPARVGTYAYVNPVIAVFLGWLLADELLNERIIIATIIIVGGVVLITREKVRQSTA
ncbi:drug/metabolite exporter YedA [bacterium]|nr:drug/metabolite exporter YedA [bacterium]